jgi:hypothetical protein
MVVLLDSEERPRYGNACAIFVESALTVNEYVVIRTIEGENFMMP